VTPYYADDQVTLYHGDALAVLQALPSGAVECIVTSPPYFGLRDYGVDGQIGAETSPAEFVAALVAVFREARRVLADDGTFWLNLGDSYNNTSSGQNGTASTGITGGRHDRLGGRRSALLAPMPAKNLIGIPWRVALALQDDGWILRNDVIWHKSNAMPESVTDRLSNRHEHMFMFSKKPRYWFDLDPIREPLAPSSTVRLAQDVESQAGSLRANGGTRSERPMRAVSRRDSFARDTKTCGPSPPSHSARRTSPPCRPHWPSAASKPDASRAASSSTHSAAPAQQDLPHPATDAATPASTSTATTST